MLSPSNSAMSDSSFSDRSVFSAVVSNALYPMPVAPPPPTPPAPPAQPAPAPPEAPPVAPSPRRGPPTGHGTGAVDRPPSSPGRREVPPPVPEVCRRLSDREAVLATNIPNRSPRKPPVFQSVMGGGAKRERVQHMDVHDILVPAQQPAATTREGAELAYPTEEPTAASPNPLRRDSVVEASSPSVSKASGMNISNDATMTTTSTRVDMKESAADEALNGTSVEAVLEGSGCDGFSLTSIAAPKTAEEYFEQVAKIDHVRCGLGRELEGDAKEVYGPTRPFARRMIATKVVATRSCPAPNCDHKAPIQAVTGPHIFSLLFIYGVLCLYPVFSTIAFAGKKGWGGIIPLWLLSGVTIIFVTLCAFTNPGIVPRRCLKNVTDRGDILIVRVPAPNAQAVLDKLQAMPDKAAPAAAAATPSAKRGSKGGDAAALYTAQALHQAVVDGDLSPSVFNHKRTTVYSMERYFETDTGRIVPYNPVLSASDLEVPTLEFPILFCRTCRIARGPRTHHCKVCNNCVDGMDHHCKWTNCCIGRNNYPYFFMSLLSLHVMVAYNLAYNFFQTIFFINSHKSWTLWEVLREFYGMPIIVYATFFFLGLFFFPLFLGHIYMTMMGLTTNELLKKKWTESSYFGGVNPWSHKHWYQNVYSRLLKRWPATEDDPMRWMDSRYYYGVAVAAAVEDQKVDWLIALPPEEQKKVEERAVAERDEGAKARPAQERAIIAKAMQKRELRVESA